MAFKNGLPRTITAETSPAYKRQKDEWEMINVLMGGTNSIRVQGREYLPQHDNESNKQYDKRLCKAVLAPYFKRSVNFSTGKAFYRELEVDTIDEKAEISEKMQAVIDDATKKGDNLNKFANTAFKGSWSKGIGYLYVEAPLIEEGQKPKTQAEMNRLDVRPYLMFIAAEDVLDIQMDENGSIIYVKILERFNTFNESMGVTQEATRLRVVTPEWIGIYERESLDIQLNSIEIQKVNNSDSYNLRGEPIPNELGMVPIVPIYTGEKRTDFDCASSLIDLAYTNIQYYQDESTHETAISYAEFPLLVLTGADGADVDVGPNKMFSIPDPSGDLKYVEHSGNALEAGRKNLEELRNKMAYCGLKVLMSDSANSGTRQQTATEAEIESVDSNSDLKVSMDNFIDALNMALWYVQLYLGEIKATDESKYRAISNGVFSITQADVREIATLTELMNDGKMRLETYYQELKARGTLTDYFNIESETAYAEENAENPSGD